LRRTKPTVGTTRGPLRGPADRRPATPVNAGQTLAPRVCVGQIGAPHGVHGAVRIRAFTEDPLAIARYGALESEDGSRQFEIERVHTGSRGLVARLAGISDRTAAQLVTNLRLYVPRDRLPGLDDDTYYHADLIGLAVVARGGATLGRVTAVHDFGAGHMLEVAPASGPAVLLPFTKSAFPVVDIAGSRMVADIPRGLMQRGEA
jgi:16S rRNA processing protein RimM